MMDSPNSPSVAKMAGKMPRVFYTACVCTKKDLGPGSVVQCRKCGGIKNAKLHEQIQKNHLDCLTQPPPVFEKLHQKI